MRFTGTIGAKCDSKGRVFFPAAFRKVLAAAGEDQLVLARDVFQPCLVMYPLRVWNEQLDTLRASLSRWNARQRMLLREFVRDIEVVTLDPGGRFLIPKRYAAKAGISRNVEFLGIDDTVEIWSPETLERQSVAADDFAIELEKTLNPQP